MTMHRTTRVWRGTWAIGPMLTLAACGGGDGAQQSTTASTSVTTAATTTTTLAALSPAEALDTCIADMDVGDGIAANYRAGLSDGGATATFQFKDMSALNGLVATCVMKELGATDFIVEQVGQATIAAGQQSAEWEGYEAVWTATSDGLRISIHAGA